MYDKKQCWECGRIIPDGKPVYKRQLPHYSTITSEHTILRQEETLCEPCVKYLIEAGTFLWTKPESEDQSCQKNSKL